MEVTSLESPEVAVKSARHREVKYPSALEPPRLPAELCLPGRGNWTQTPVPALWREGLAGLPAADLPKAVSVMFLGPGKSPAHSRLDRAPALCSCLVLPVPTSVT